MSLFLKRLQQIALAQVEADETGGTAEIVEEDDTVAAAGTVGTASDPHFANVVLLVGFDGSDGATSATDESLSAHTPFTWVGNAQLDTAEKKFGSASLLLGGSGDMVSVPDSDDWNFGSGAFTIECWVRFAILATNNFFLSQSGGTNGSNGFHLNLTSSGVLSFSWRSTAPSNPSLDSSAGVMTTGQWYHVAVDRTGNTLRLYVDGVMVGKDASWTTTQANIAEAFRFGARGAPGSGVLNGWMDEVRITKGVARYASDAGFTVPTGPFPRS